MIEITRTDDPKEILSQLHDTGNPKKGYELAVSKRLNFSALLETISPTKPGDPLDAYERCLQACGIIVKGDPDRGIYPSTGALFFQGNMPESRVLFPEFINRTIRAALMDESNILSYLVAGWETADVNLFRSFYIDDTEAQRRSGKRAEGAKPRKFKVSWSEKAVSTTNFAIELDMTYEFIRWASLPIIQLVLQRAALQRQLDEAGEAIYVLKNGDGTGKESSGAPEVALSALGISSGDVNYKAYLKFLASFYPYLPSTMVGPQDDIVDLLCMAKPSADPALLYTLLDKSATGGVPLMPNMPFSKMTFLQFNDSDILASHKVMTVDKRYALQGHRAFGLELVETDKLISAQFEKIVVSNHVGFSNILRAASKILNITTVGGG